MNYTSPAKQTKSLETVSIGDSISIGLNKAFKNSIDILKDPELSKVGEDSKWLISKLKNTSQIFSEYKNVILSIGSNEGWSSDKSTKDQLVNLVRARFPNAELYILNGSWGWGGLAQNAQNSDDYWKQNIDSYLLYFSDKKCKVVGQKTKLKSHPQEGDELFNSIRLDLQKYQIIPSTAQTSVNKNSVRQSALQIGKDEVIQRTGRGSLDLEQNVKRESDIRNQITGKGIVNLFPSNVKLPRMVIPAELSEDAKKEFIRGLGYLPVVFYNTIQIDVENISFFEITYRNGIPILTMQFMDWTGLMKNVGTPTDNSHIMVFINPRSENLRPIYIQFKITDFEHSGESYKIIGTLDVGDLYIQSYQEWSDSTSNKTLQLICKQIGLGFNTNIVETFDRMNWVNSGQKIWEFMNTVISRAYISDESFIAGNIDLYYNLNFIDVQKELSRNIDDEMSELSTGLNEVLSVPNSDSDTKASLFLTSDESLKGSNSFFSSFKLTNKSTETAIKRGYSDNLIYYDTFTKELVTFEVNSLNGNVEKSIVLKGGGANDDFFEKNKNYRFGGKLVPDNTHRNYNYSKTQNYRNILEAEKLVAEIELPFPNFTIYRFQQIKLIISHNSTTITTPAINARYSGDWLILDIKYTLSGGSFKQIVTLVKRELQLSSEELERLKPNKSRPEGRGTNINPLLVGTASNVN